MFLQGFESLSGVMTQAYPACFTVAIVFVGSEYGLFMQVSVLMMGDSNANVVDKRCAYFDQRKNFYS